MVLKLNEISPLSNAVVKFLMELTKNEYVENIIVFGSRSLGDYEEYSDLDLAIDAPKIPKYDWFKLKEYAIYDVPSIIRLSLVHYSTNPKKLKERIINTGKIIYVKQS